MKKQTGKQQKQQGKKKLELRKETLRKLTNKELDQATGGVFPGQPPQPTFSGHCIG